MYIKLAFGLTHDGTHLENLFYNLHYWLHGQVQTKQLLGLAFAENQKWSTTLAWTCHLPTIFPEPKFCDSSVSDRRKGCGSRSLPDLMHSVMKSNETTGIPYLTAVLPL